MLLYIEIPKAERLGFLQVLEQYLDEYMKENKKTTYL